MQSGVDVDGVDFRPFFDMVVGILFVLLILIGALLFFQQSAQDENGAREAERNARLAEIQTKQFLQALAEHLGQAGFVPRLDITNKFVGLPLAEFAKVGSAGFPELAGQRVEAMGAVLARDLSCVVATSRRPDRCPGYDRIRLNLALLQIQAGDLNGVASLPQDQFARLLTSEFAAALFHQTPALLGLTNDAGSAALDTVGRLSSAPAPPGESVGGEIEVHLEFTSPQS